MRIGQVLGNLISNAMKYGDPKTAVDVSVDRTDGEVKIAVTNYGPGIEPLTRCPGSSSASCDRRRRGARA